MPIPGLPLNRGALESALRLFYPYLTKEQVRELVGPEGQLTLEALRELLVDNPPTVSSSNLHL